MHCPAVACIPKVYQSILHLVFGVIVDGHPMGVITIKFVFEVHNKRFIVSVRR